MGRSFASPPRHCSTGCRIASATRLRIPGAYCTTFRLAYFLNVRKLCEYKSHWMAGMDNGTFIGSGPALACHDLTARADQTNLIKVVETRLLLEPRLA